MATMEDVAKAAKVSRATVSRVLSNSSVVKSETSRKVMYWVKKLGYEPNKLAQSLAGNRSGIIGVIVPNITNPFYSASVEAIEEAASEEGYNIIICCSNRSKEKEDRYIKDLRSRKVDGIIIYPVGVDNIERFSKYNFPIVSIGKKIEGRSAVLSDLEGGAALIAKHFLELGHKKIGYIGPTEAPKNYNKYAGFKQYLDNNNISLNQIITYIPSENNNSIELIIKDYIKRNGMNCSAWFADNDLSAIELMKVLQGEGYSIPDDVIIAGYDNTLISEVSNPKLTSVYQPLKELGKESIKILINNILEVDTSERNINFENKLIVRDSTIKNYEFK